MRTKRIDFSQGNNKQEATLGDNNTELSIDRTIYAKLADRTANRVLTVPEDNDSPYNRWLLAMQELSKTGIATPEIERADTYLATLGVTDEYPYMEDRFDIDKWITYDSQAPSRPIVHAVPHTNPKQAVIDRATGHTVVHDTHYLDTI